MMKAMMVRGAAPSKQHTPRRPARATREALPLAGGCTLGETVTLMDPCPWLRATTPSAKQSSQAKGSIGETDAGVKRRAEAVQGRGGAWQEHVPRCMTAHRRGAEKQETGNGGLVLSVMAV